MSRFLGFHWIALLLIGLCLSSSNLYVQSRTVHRHRPAHIYADPLSSSPSSSSSSDLKSISAVTSIGSVYYNGGVYSFKGGINDTSAVAMGTFIDTNNITGWGELWIQTNPSYADSIQMYAAGYLEGVLTAERIYESVLICRGIFPDLSLAIVNFLQNQTEWTRTSIKNAEPNDSKWSGMALIMQQFDGIVAGYNAYPINGEYVSAFDFNLLQLEGDIGDIKAAVEPSSRPDFNMMTRDECIDHIHHNRQDHCSVLIKVLGDLSDIYASHSTWAGYSVMNRIFKHYHLELISSFIAAKKISFSSYPGMIESYDDFWYMDTGLIMVETNIDIYNMSLYDNTIPQALLGWQRIRLACQNANNGQEWYEHLSWHNGGTYNNEYLILDYKLFTPGHSLVPNTLWLMDQIPGHVIGTDVTNILSFGYMASYNVPWFEEIYNATGYPTMITKLGDDNDNTPGLKYQIAPRAQIFRRDQGKVVDLLSFQHLMRYNDYKHDPISQGDPFNAICSRGDLYSSAEAFGCIDSKVISYTLYQEGRSYMINGPTTNNGTLPPFSWQQFPEVVHSGEPDIFNYDWIDTQWKE